MSGARSFRLVLEYDGTDFEGWQVQAGRERPVRTVQGCLQEALGALAEGPGRVVVVGAGRTDAGVHAAGQVASVRLATRHDADTLRRALNARLPRDIVVRDASPAPPDFDARRHARTKLYRYQIWNGRDRSPLRDRQWTRAATPLDLDAMARAARDLEGRHDFACFRAAGSSVKTSVRTLHRIRVAGEPGGEVVIEVLGDGFLRHMVRNLAGTLLEVGRGARAPGSMPALLAGRDRSRAGPTAPARGLVLVRVDTEPPGEEHSV